MTILHRFFALLLLSLPAWQPASADMLVLVHGYASDAGTWEASGVNAMLESRGWRRAGILSAAPAGDLFVPAAGEGSARRSYSVNLPAEAPLLVQAGLLNRMLDNLRRHHPQERLILIGHSAGGVVARLALLGGNPFDVDTLVTIAAPHLGTWRAAQGLDVVDSKPFFCPGPGIDFLKTVIGGNGYEYLKHSRGVLIDLLPATPGTLLYQANLQPHPDIHYYSIVREAPFRLGDELVPAFSQDMNNVPALRGRVTTRVTGAGHSLVPADGALLADLLGPQPL